MKVLYNAIKWLTRKVIYIMRLRRDLSLVVVSILLTVLYASFSSKFWDDNNSLSVNVLSTVGFFGVLLLLGGIAFWLLSDMRKIDKIEEEKDMEAKAEISAIVKKLGITQEEIDKQKPHQSQKETDKS